MSDDPLSQTIGRRGGQLLFAAAFLLVAFGLLALLGQETTWAEGTRLVAQPGFWPAIGVGGMVLFGGLHLWNLPRRRFARSDFQEGAQWVRVLEFAGWFIAYVLIVPLAGYLPTTIVFMPLLLWRMGYRSRLILWSGVGFGVAVVVVFKMFLSVRIPGGAVYEYLPGALRSVFILNF